MGDLLLNFKLIGGKFLPVIFTALSILSAGVLHYTGYLLYFDIDAVRLIDFVFISSFISYFLAIIATCSIFSYIFSVVAYTQLASLYTIFPKNRLARLARARLYLTHKKLGIEPFRLIIFAILFGYIYIGIINSLVVVFLSLSSIISFRAGYNDSIALRLRGTVSGNLNSDQRHLSASRFISRIFMSEKYLRLPIYATTIVLTLSFIFGYLHAMMIATGNAVEILSEDSTQYGIVIGSTANGILVYERGTPRTVFYTYSSIDRFVF